MTQAMLAVAAATLIALASSLFGVCIARLVWAEDLKHAIKIKEVSDRIIATQQRHINILRGRLGEAPL